MQSFTIGQFKITPLSDGSMWFDGGVMFHIIPKPLWEQKVFSDEQNRIEVFLNALLVEYKGEDPNIARNILIEAGAGNKLTDKQKQIFNRRDDISLPIQLESAGVHPQEIEKVLLTHLHKDHIGTLTHYDEQGNLACTYANATHYALQEEWDFANGGNELSRVSYNPDDFMPVADKNLFEYVSSDSASQGYEVVPSITMHRTGGHTAGHAFIQINHEDNYLLFPGDIIPTCQHISLNWVCSYDYWSYEVVEQKKKFLQYAYDKNALVFLVHEGTTPLVRITKENDRFSYEVADIS